MTTWEEWAKYVEKQLKDHQEKIFDIRWRANRALEQVEKMQPIYDEYLKGRILELLSKEEKPRTQGYIARRLGRDIYSIMRHLIHEGKIHATKSGHWDLYELTE